MFDKPTKKLIIVGNKDTDVYCEFLSLLVSTKDDVTVEKEDGTKEKTIFYSNDTGDYPEESMEYLKNMNKTTQILKIEDNT